MYLRGQEAQAWRRRAGGGGDEGREAVAGSGSWALGRGLWAVGCDRGLMAHSRKCRMMQPRQNVCKHSMMVHASLK